MDPIEHPSRGVMKSHVDPATEFDGRCAFAVSLGKFEVAGNPKWVASRDGKTYTFSNPIARLLWKVLPGTRKKAEAKWSARSSPN